MLSPNAHLKSLERHLAIHEAQIAGLENTAEAIEAEIQRQRGLGEAEVEQLPRGKREPGLALRRDAVGAMIEAHRTLLALGRNKRTVATIRKLAADPALAREAARDPMGYARANGVPIPRGIVLEALVTAQQVSLRISYNNEFAPGRIVWNADGFSAPRLMPAVPNGREGVRKDRRRGEDKVAKVPRKRKQGDDSHPS